MCAAVAWVGHESLSAASLEVTGKTFINKPCNVSIDGDARFNTSRSPGAAISMGAGASCVTFEGTGGITLYGEPGIEITGEGETFIVFRTLPNFCGLNGQDVGTAILGNDLTTVCFENVQGTVNGNIAVGNLVVNSDADVVVYEQNLPQAPLEANVQPDELSNSTTAEGPLPEIVAINDEKTVLNNTETPFSPFAHLPLMRNILLQSAPVHDNAIYVGKFKTSHSGYEGVFLACQHALKNTPASLTAIAGHIGPIGLARQNCYGFCLANTSEDFAWNMYGLSSENRHQTYLRNRIVCAGCLQEYSLWHIRRKNYTIRPILGLGAEYQVVFRTFWDVSSGEAVDENSSQMLANFSLALNMACNSGKTNFTVRTGLWRPIHSAVGQRSSDKLHLYDMRCTQCFFRNLKGELTLTKSSFESEFRWGLTLICNF
ncbi:MAG: hypothetical protein LBF26_01015 [Puniceicoccales bacterium]|jgi:hypothetical protein|nr:hypothetical protein [Puniceicoccales bacterium]